MTKEEIKGAYSMRDILRRYGLPEQNRAGFICCPFHREKTPSMKVYAKDFHCFGCGAHGDIFDFVRRMDGVSFQGAFAELGGTQEGDFHARMEAYHARKRRERRAEAGAALRRAREECGRTLSRYRRALDGQGIPDTQGMDPAAWAEATGFMESAAFVEACRGVAYQEYLWEALHDPEECWAAIGMRGGVYGD